MKNIAIICLSILCVGLVAFVIYLVFYRSILSSELVATVPPPDSSRNIQLKDVYSGINEIREEHGLTSLKIDSRLEVSACAKASDMMTKNYWAHNAPDGTEPWGFIRSAGFRYADAGENLAAGYDTASGVVSAWENSPTHLANIVGNYTHTGLCLLSGELTAFTKYGNDDIHLIVNHFAR